MTRFRVPVPVSVRVPAKVNLQLAVGPRRADGYHDLVTVFHAVSLYDEITVEPSGRDRVTVTGEGADQVPAGRDNLALRAALAGWAGSAPEAERLLRAAGIDPGARGESLSVAEFARLAAARTITSS